MLFAFAASAALFDAALRWESNGTNLRRAAMVADKRMEELREWAVTGGSGTTFPTDAEWMTESTRVTSYPEAPGFEIEVNPYVPQYAELLSSGVVPEQGFHSPCSSLYTLAPDDPGGVPNPSGLDPFLDNNPQYNYAYKSYPYSRRLDNSYRMVEIVISYGSGTSPLQYRLISLIGDPIPGGSANVSVSPSGGSYQANVSVGGRTVPDMVVHWGSPLTPGTGNEIGAYHRPTTATATITDVKAMPGNVGTHMLTATVRYRGQSRSGSLGVNLP